MILFFKVNDNVQLFKFVYFIRVLYSCYMLEQKRKQLIHLITKLGYPLQFATLITDELHTEMQITRMIGYLLQVKKVRMEDIVDEMLAIKEDFKMYQQKKIREYNNAQYNDMLLNGLIE